MGTRPIGKFCWKPVSTCNCSATCRRASRTGWPGRGSRLEGMAARTSRYRLPIALASRGKFFWPLLPTRRQTLASLVANDMTSGGYASAWPQKQQVSGGKKRDSSKARLRFMPPYWTHGIEPFWKTLRRLLVCILLFFCAFSALPKFARYVNVVWPCSLGLHPPPSSKRCISTVEHYCIATSSCIPPPFTCSSANESSTTSFFNLLLLLFSSTCISHDLVVSITLIIPHACPDLVPPFHFSTLGVLPVPGPCLLGDPLWSHLLEVRSCLNSALPIYCGSLRNLFGYKLWHPLWLVCQLLSFLTDVAVEKDNLVFHAETYRYRNSTLCRSVGYYSNQYRTVTFRPQSQGGSQRHRQLPDCEPQVLSVCPQIWKPRLEEFQDQILEARHDPSKAITTVVLSCHAPTRNLTSLLDLSRCIRVGRRRRGHHVNR